MAIGMILNIVVFVVLVGVMFKIMKA